jgi:hypothetical protein
MCARVGNQRSRGVVTAWVRIDTVWSLHHQRRDLHQLTYPVPLCHTPPRDSRNEASIRVPRMFHSHV